MTPEAAAEIAMCNECISHLLENVGPDHIIVKYRAALIKSQEQVEEIKQANHRYADLQNICDDQEKEIKRLQTIISEPVESFGTPELITWAEELQAIIAKWPESERGELPFVMLMGSHLEKFARGWNSPTIKRLEAERAVWIKHYQDNRKKHAALKKLGEMVRARGKALVEERAMDDAKLPELCDIVHDELMCPALDGDCEHWEGCPRKDEMRKAARKQLRAEGVIGK